jgi:hypothetical protein
LPHNHYIFPTCYQRHPSFGSDKTAYQVQHYWVIQLNCCIFLSSPVMLLFYTQQKKVQYQVVSNTWICLESVVSSYTSYT